MFLEGCIKDGEDILRSRLAKRTSQSRPSVPRDIRVHDGPAETQETDGLFGDVVRPLPGA